MTKDFFESLFWSVTRHKRTNRWILRLWKSSENVLVWGLFIYLKDSACTAVRIATHQKVYSLTFTDFSLTFKQFSLGVWHLQTADRRLQIADCKLNDTKNLPNKGDVIKNITSCESEKVAWEQGWYFCAKLHWPHFQDAVGYSSPTRLFIDSSGISLIALILYSSLIIVNW